MYLAVVAVSQPNSPNYSKYEDLLSDGWLFGRKVDNSDGQYAGFRDNVSYLTLLVVFHPLARRGYEALMGRSKTTQANRPGRTNSSNSSAEQRLRYRLTFDFYSSLIFISALHGFSAFKILIILYINFSIANRIPREAIPAVTWIFNICILFANELTRGYSYGSIMESMAPFYAEAGNWGKFLDSWGGIIPRWDVSFNITVLRLISFNMDHYWAMDRSRSGSPLEVSPITARMRWRRTDHLKKKQLDPASFSERDRVSVPAPARFFNSFPTYLAYALYPPLYIAGPILTFNDYLSQSTYQAPSIDLRRTALYGIRFLLTLFCMEFLLHTIYVVAISKASPDWSAYTPFQLSMLAYFNLHIIWLKLLLPWRFFRFWSLIDGIDPPENVIRCMSDNYSAQQFWRAWHRSYNRWIVRYIYIPLGGGAGGGTSTIRGIANMLAVFTFVALWHDINLRLLMWGWLVVLFVLPEVLATMAFPRNKWESRPTAYRMICGVGAVGNILMMMAANLVGFAVGLDGLKGLIAGIVGSWQGGLFMLGACGALFVGAQVMFEHREEEKRKGIRLKC
jgi:protein-cysteine N-palmitoyltransferase HHAT